MYILRTVIVCLLYLTTAELGLEYAVVGQTVTLLWPPSGIALVAIIIGGRHIWLGVALGAFVANAWTGIPFVTLALITLGNTLEPLCGAYLLRRSNSFSPNFDKISDVLNLLLYGALLSTTLGASFGTFGLFAGGEITRSELGVTWLAWWLGDGLGILLISPMILTGFGLSCAMPRLTWSITAFEALAMIIALTIAGNAIFGNPQFVGLGYFPVSLSMFPFAIWSGLRFGSFGAAGVALLASLLAMDGTVRGTGPFVSDSVIGSLIRWCLYADVMGITGLLLAAVSAEREKALAALKVSNENLETQVQKRTLELTLSNEALQKTLTERRRLQLEMNQIGEERQKMIGQELHDGLGQQITGIAFLVSSLYETLAASSASEAPLVHQVKQLLDDALMAIRSLSRGLYPVALETGGFTAALQHLAEFARSSSGIECIVRCADGAQIRDRTITLNLYRIAQEAVCNALRHSKAQRIEIKLSTNGKQYSFSVEDNGIGFPVEQSDPKNGTLGLRSIRCRADLIGAELIVGHNRDGGTSIVVTGFHEA